MKKNPGFMAHAALTALVSIALTGILRADEAHYRGSPLGSKVHIDGSANIHDWSMTGTLIVGSFDLPAGVELDSTQADIAGLKGDKLNAHAEVSIPVNSVQSGTEGMDSVMQQAMDAKDYPRIIFHLTQLDFKGPHAANTPFKFDAKGELSMNGVTNSITMPVTIENAEKQRLKITGSVPLKMTDFKVPPPVKAHLFVTRPDVKISFEWLLTRHDKPAGTK
jgi:hypothetical protein